MMRKWTAVLAPVLLALAWAALPPAAELYDQVFPKVLEAKRVLAKDPAQALVLVEDAQKAYAKGKDRLPAVIAAGIEQALKDARVAVARRSKGDLEGRIWVVRGAFGKALYDAFFEAVAKGDLEAAKPLLDRLVEASARPETLKAEAEKLAEAKDLAGLRKLFEGAYLEAMVKTLDLARHGDDRVRAYALTSKAYGLFLIVQDSPRVREVQVQDFIDALKALTQGDPATYRKKLGEIRGRLAAALEAVKGAPKAPAPKPAPPPSPGPETQTPPAAPPRAAAPKPAPKPPAPRAAAPLLPRAAPPARVDTFRAPDWMPKGLAAKVRSRAAALGYLYLSDYVEATEDVRDDVSRATALLGSADIEGARRYLDRAWWHYQTRVVPLAELASPLAPRVGTLLERLRRIPGVRTSDLTTLYTLISAVESTFLNGQPTKAERIWLDLQASLLGFTGLPRAVMFLLAGALAFFPLFLIRLTFGGRNVYWRLLGLAFFFLLLPAMIEALTYLGDILANYGGLPQLAQLINLSVLQSLAAQVGWGVSILLVVVLAGWGLRGIAHQFGLIRERAGAPTTAQELSPTATSESVVEWDEEF